ALLQQSRMKLSHVSYIADRATTNGHRRPEVLEDLTVLIFTLQIMLSGWWLKHFRFGPAEWLWRTLTYGKLQPMRLRRA
ncbi:MAG: DUF418 domain-containing protein, partial [Candidatus Binatia bacterium]